MQNHSQYQFSASLSYANGELIKAEVDIREELDLRGDGVSVGKIKKEQKRELLLQILINNFVEFYNFLDY